MSEVHTDVLFVIFVDLSARFDRGEITISDYLEQGVQINNEIHRRYTEVMLSNERRISELERLQKDNQESYKSNLQQYDNFLLLKGLSEEFEEWEWEQIEKNLEELEGGPKP